MTPAREALFREACAALREKLAAYGTGPERFGLVHADLRAANLLLTPAQEICAIDFDDSGQSWFLYDLASALSFIETAPDLPQLIARWIEGYERIVPLTAEDRAMMCVGIWRKRERRSALRRMALAASARVAALTEIALAFFL